MLSEKTPLKRICQWAKEFTEELASDVINHESAEALDNVNLRWNYYSSIIIRDLAMMSAKSFGTSNDFSFRALYIFLGSFQLLKILLDEYVACLIDLKKYGSV